MVAITPITPTRPTMYKLIIYICYVYNTLSDIFITPCNAQCLEDQNYMSYMCSTRTFM